MAVKTERGGLVRQSVAVNSCSSLEKYAQHRKPENSQRQIIQHKDASDLPGECVACWLGVVPWTAHVLSEPLKCPRPFWDTGRWLMRGLATLLPLMVKEQIGRPPSKSLECGIVSFQRSDALGWQQDPSCWWKAELAWEAGYVMLHPACKKLGIGMLVINWLEFAQLNSSVMCLIICLKSFSSITFKTAGTDLSRFWNPCILVSVCPDIPSFQTCA